MQTCYEKNKGNYEHSNSCILDGRQEISSVPHFQDLYIFTRFYIAVKYVNIIKPHFS